MKLSTKHLSIAFLSIALGLAFLPIGQIVECNAIAGATTTLQCSDGSRISPLWSVMSLATIGTGFILWMLRNNVE